MTEVIGQKQAIPQDTVECADSLTYLKALPDECIDLVMTSPPYWGLRSYGVDGAFGLEPTYQEYVRHIGDVCMELKRVLKESGSFYLNIGDTYSGNNNWGTAPPRPRDGPRASEVRSTYPQPNHESNLPSKCLIGIPRRLEVLLVDTQGWILRNRIIWHKNNHMPSSVRDRLTNSYEFLFHFVKNSKTILWRYTNGTWSSDKPTIPQFDENDNPNWFGHSYYYDLDAIRVPHAISSIKRATQPTVMDQEGGWKQDELRGIPKSGNASRSNKMVQSLAQKFTKSDMPVRTGDGRDRNTEGRSYGWTYDQKTLHPLGKNPGDTIDGDLFQSQTYQGKFEGFAEKSEEYGSPRARTQRKHGGNQTNPSKVPLWRDQKRQEAGLPSWDPSHPLGKNPGDAITLNQIDSPAWQLELWFDFSSNPPLCRGCGTPINKHTLGDNKGKIAQGHHAIQGQRARWNGKLIAVCNPNGQNPSDFWSINTKPFKQAHFAVYPEELCIRPILSSSPRGGLVLDPFNGSGTTCVVAKKLGRHYLGIDLNSNYCKIARKRLEAVPWPLDMYVAK